MGCTEQGRVATVLLASIGLLLPAVGAASDGDYPHAERHGVACVNCHLPPQFPPPDDTRCLECHDGQVSVEAAGHSSAVVGEQYGTWGVSCATCHSPHVQRQHRSYGSESYVFWGFSDPGGITATTLTTFGAGWIPDEFAGYVLVPNTGIDELNYRIIGNTEDTILVSAAMDPEVGLGDTEFAIIYGKLIKSTVSTPNSGDRPVRFFAGSGASSFADGDATYDGICEVCHTQTNHKRNDGLAPGDYDGSTYVGHNDGSQCTDCHPHTSGFKPRCDSCHGYPPVSGAHATHFDPNLVAYWGISCDTCHFNAEHRNGTPDIRGGPALVSLASMTFDGAMCSGACHVGAVWEGAPLLCYDCHAGPGSNFLVDVPPQPAPVLIPEADLETTGVTVVTLEWNAAASSYGPPSYAEYLVEVDDDSDFSSVLFRSDWLRGTSVAVTIDDPGLWYWRVQARDAVRPPVVSGWQTDSFNVTETGAPPTPSLIPEPDFSSSGAATEVVVQWNAVIDPQGDPVEYMVQLDHNQAFLNPVSSGWISETEFSHTTSCEGWYWRVRARDATNGTTSTWSGTDYFQDIYNCGGSCPFLFVWDGTSYQFGTDLNGPGKLATRSSRGYFTPNPHDYYVLGTEPALIGGRYELRLVEERFEVDYLDQMKLFAVDIPANRELYANKPTFGSPFASLIGELHTVDANLVSTLPAVHVNTGQDVSTTIASSDGDFLVLSNDRNIDFAYNTIELDLGPGAAQAPQLKLVIDGMTAFPTTPQGVMRSREFGPRTKIQVLDDTGAWVSVPGAVAVLPKLPEFRRPFVLEVSNIFVSTTFRVRLTFLFKTYIDSIRLDTSADVTPELRELRLATAKLRSYGHSETRLVIDDIFEYVYNSQNPNDEHEYFPGSYTRFGDVKALLRRVDDEFVIYGSGDELALSYAPWPQGPERGKRRKFLLYSNGYYKDAKSAVPATVEPLPFADMSNFPYDPAVEQYPDDTQHRRYRSKYNRRTVP